METPQSTTVQIVPEEPASAEQPQQQNGNNPPATQKEEGNIIRTSINKLKAKFIPGIKYSLLISLIFNFAMLVIGCLSVHKCPVNQEIPLFLIALGAIGIMSKLVTYVRERILRYFQVKYLESALYTSETIFFLLGTYWVYKEYKPSFDPLDGKAYCDKTAYMFAFIYLTTYYAIVLAILVGFVIFLVCICCVTACVKNELDEAIERERERDVEAGTDKDKEEQESKESLTKNEKSEGDQ